MEMMEVKVGDFKAMITPFNKLPFTKVLPIYQMPNGLAMFTAGVELMRDEIAVELRPAFDALSADETVAVINQWLQVSDEK